MSDLYLLSEDKIARTPPYFPLPHAVARVDDRCRYQRDFLCCQGWLAIERRTRWPLAHIKRYIINLFS